MKTLNRIPFTLSADNKSIPFVIIPRGTARVKRSFSVTSVLLVSVEVDSLVAVPDPFAGRRKSRGDIQIVWDFVIRFSAIRFMGFQSIFN